MLELSWVYLSVKFLWGRKLETQNMLNFGIINKKKYFTPCVFLMLKINMDFKNGMKWIMTKEHEKKKFRVVIRLRLHILLNIVR